MDGQSAPKIRLVLNRATLPPPQQQQQQSYEYDEMSSPAQASQLTTGIKLKINPAAIHLKKRRKPAPRYANNPPTAEEMEIEPYPVEDHVIFRMPPNDPLTPRLREIIQQRLPFPPDLSIEWRDSRRGLLKWGEEVLLAKLVDLPCIIESQKTFDRKQFFKVADICQMVVIERPRTEGDNDRFFTRLLSPEDTIFNSGITPPLKYCRLRRFRRRVNRRTVESIEREVARLMREDSKAIEVQTEFVDSKELEDRLNAEDEDDEHLEGEINFADEEYEDVDEDGMGNSEYAADQGEDGSGYGSDDTMDSELAAQLENEISRAVAEASESSGDEDEEEGDEDEAEAGGQIGEEGEEDESGDDEMDEQTRQLMQQQKALREEMRNLNEKIVEKTDQRNQSVNMLMKKRFDDIIRKLTTELELKQSQLAQVQFSLQKRASDDYDDDEDEVDVDDAAHVVEDEEEEEEDDER